MKITVSNLVGMVLCFKALDHYFFLTRPGVYLFGADPKIIDFNDRLITIQCFLDRHFAWHLMDRLGALRYDMI